MSTFAQLLQGVIPQFETYLLLLVRVSFIFLVAPVFGSRTIPRRLKVALAAVLALAVYPAVATGESHSFDSFWSLVPAMVGEAAVGLTVGISARLIFFSVQLAGFIAGFQMGFLIANTIDPQEGRNTPLIAQFQEIMALLLFLAIDGHHWLLKGLVGSYQIVPAFGASFSGAVVATFVEMTGRVFVIALKIAAPVMIASLMTKFAMGILARTVPQMNVFVISFPLNIGVGLLTIALSLQVVSLYLEGQFQGIGDQMARMLAGFR
jgi:flagellar biosynthetic protein FliR